VAESVIPIGINIHKDGSVIAGVLRIVFTVAFFGLSGYGCFEIVGIAILTSLVVGAIPVGGMTAEVLACSFLGIEPGFAATLLVISTLVDIPATLLNTSDNIVAAAWVDKLCKRKEEEKPV
jgi:Na+/H+-dicarboxylate symporters